MFAVQELTVDGWSNRAEHASKDNAFWHARARSDADGHTYRLISMIGSPFLGDREFRPCRQWPKAPFVARVHGLVFIS